MTRAWLLSTALATFVCSCDGDAAAPAPSVEALLGGTSMSDTPWPSDVFLRAGRLEVRSIPLEGSRGPLDTMAATLSEMDGAPIYGSVFFPTTGTLEDGPVEGTATWIDLDAPGATIETTLWNRASTNELVARAPRGDVLAAGHRYAVVVESPRVRPSAAMRDALEGRGPHAPAYAPLASYPRREAIAAATVFTVGRPTALVERMREVAAARPPAVAKVTKVLRGADLEDFTGQPTTTRPGFGDPAGIVHDQLEAIVLGTFDVPSFLSATPPKLGRVELDAQGSPIVKGVEAVPFLLTLPRKPAAGWGKVPILVFQHGLNADRTQVLSCANDYARAGYATIGIDALWHGGRAPRPKDEAHTFGRTPGPDGVADGDTFGAAVSLFDFGGDAAQGIGAFDGRYVRDNFRQAIVDLTELARFLRTGDLSPVTAADPSLSGLSFDGEHVVYTSESFGSVLGASVVAISPDLAGAVLSVAGGGVFLPMFPNSPTFNGLLTPFVKTSFDPYLDLSDPAVLPGDVQRSLSLLEAAISPGDPLSFASLVHERKRNVLVIQARSDELIPNQATELLARAMHATYVTLPSRSEPPRFVTLPIVPAPHQAPPGEGTIAVVQLAPALHTVFTGFTGERRYELDFPPFTALPAPERVDNPTELAHDLALAFAASLRAGGPGTVAALPR